MRLSTKLILLVGAASAVGFGTLVTMMTLDSEQALRRAHQQRSETLATSVATGIQNVMVTGKDIHAEALVQDSRDLPGVHALRVFDKDGHEVFLERTKTMGDVDAAAKSAATTGQPTRAGDDLVRAIPNDPSCAECHHDAGAQRGALAIGLQANDDGDLVFTFGKTALEHVMLSGEAEMVNGFLERLLELPAVADAYVLGPNAELVFGKKRELSPTVVAAAQRLLESGGKTTVEETTLYAVENREACHVCHGDDHARRGVLAFRLGEPLNDRLEAAASMFEKSLIQLMLSGGGNSLEAYLRELRSAEVITRAGLFDETGTEVFPPLLGEARKRRGPRTQDGTVLTTLSSGEATGVEANSIYSHMVPLPNEIRCQACHGSDHEVRGLVEVQTDLRPLETAVRANVQRAAIAVVVFVIATSLLLLVFLRWLLVRPVLQISHITQQVAQGHLDTLVDHKSSDEVGDLAARVNEMILGLRSKLMMERFVGDHTRRMIDESVRGDHGGLPVRREIAVLFSDVRGFTAYSEQHEPERVIHTLNVYLGVQAEMVEKHGGYVDKFVGDEVMALFEGEGKEIRALRAAQDMIRAVQTADVADHMSIGVGINAGDVVFGSTGSDDRMDYTVIGDVVNLGARLCAAAGQHTILVSQPIYDAAGETAPFGEPQQLTVKGKVAPLQVYSLLLTPRDAPEG